MKQEEQEKPDKQEKELTWYLKNQLTKKKSLFIPYLALNDPDWDISYEIVKSFFDLGADTIELGLPFTDPVADGPVLQKSFIRIFEHKFHLNEFLSFIGKVHKNYPEKPLVVMGYANLFYHHGFSKTFQKMEKAGVKGLVIPDLPFEEKQNFPEIKKTSLALIDFITPTTKYQTIEKIAKQAEGFLYLVSTKGVTGKSKIDPKIESLAKSLRKFTDVPVLVGFGIRTKEHLNKISKFADGFIIGSLIHEIIEKNLMTPGES